MRTTTTVLILSVLATSSLATQLVLADCPLAHTHIGINPTWRPDWSNPADQGGATDSDLTDNNKLWFFSLPPVHATAPTPNWPNWGDPSDAPFLKLVQETDSGGNPIVKPSEANKTLYTCRFMYGLDGYGDQGGVQHLDGWHSAHGPQGVWNLESVAEETEPAWDIGIQRETTSLADPTDFFMLRPDDSLVLSGDGDTYKFSDHGEKTWLADMGAWGIHSHMGFYFWLDDSQENDEITVAFTAFDDSGLYASSDPFTFRFAVPEPGTLSLLVFMGISVATRRTS